MFTTFFQMTALPFTEYLNPEDLMQEERIAQSRLNSSFLLTMEQSALLLARTALVKLLFLNYLYILWTKQPSILFMSS